MSRMNPALIISTLWIVFVDSLTWTFSASVSVGFLLLVGWLIHRYLAARSSGTSGSTDTRSTSDVVKRTRGKPRD